MRIVSGGIMVLGGMRVYVRSGELMHVGCALMQMRVKR